MRAFAQLICKIDESTKTQDKLSALVGYFRDVSPSDGSWAIYFLSGNRLSRCLPPKAIRLSEAISFGSWTELDRIRDQSRSRGTEGVMLKSLSSAYHAGRPRGIWWKWKVEPFTIDAVLIYAQRGHGRRANLYPNSINRTVVRPEELATLAIPTKVLERL